MVVVMSARVVYRSRLEIVPLPHIVALIASFLGAPSG